ncbi:histidine kinase [Dyadobacter sp. LHD-138]|uniref:sensor histidine kinase n=1 Tax=Dyadobacter sp. LHD-138 TaxID=3071413 RepID=UPI0027E14752|nr:histidine kinase [Dyadobacter sp. LHD-138]MDQ6477202.1 histidine kinase [Dyadobacter sp. LHD-138]
MTRKIHNSDLVGMNNPRTKLITNRSKTIILASISFVMFYIFQYMLDPYDRFWKNYFTRPVTELLIEWFVSMLFCVLISMSSISIHEKLNKSIPWIEKPLVRLGIETCLNIASVVLLIFTLLISMSYLIADGHGGYSEHEMTIAYWQWSTVSIFIALIISAIHTGDYLIMNWKNADLEATEHKLKSAEHKQAAAEAELQALKLQLDPHFVFNNLSVLSELILEDQQLGYNYSENFSKVYRYLLLNSKRNLITLEEELKFLNAYIFLLEHRAGSRLEFEIQVDNAHLSLCLPPMTLQLLIENAMKHNKFVKTNPLKIKVHSSQNMDLIVSNSIIPLEKKGVSSGIGLHNIIQRYLLLSDRTPEINTNDNLFTVSIPLLKP